MRRSLVALFLMAWMPLAAAAQSPAPPAAAPASSTSPSVQDVAESAYVYGFPMIDLYRIMYGYFIAKGNPAYKAPFNTLVSSANVYTPADKTVQTPNSDTPYSFAGLDLRAEPMVLTLPAIDPKRYVSVQFVDQYTFNIDYVGSRTTGNGAARVLIAGPNWKGTPPAGITKVVHFDTQFGVALIRTQLFGHADIGKVRAVQSGYGLQPLSAYGHTTPPAPAPAVAWPTPLSPSDERTSPAFFDRLAFLLQFCPTDPTETALRASFATAGIVPGKPFDAGTNAAAYVTGMSAGQAQIDAERKQQAAASALFGTRASMKNDFLLRAVGAQYGILGNTAAEAVYLGYVADATKAPLSGANRYTIHFAKGSLPPVNAFWSVTMYDLPAQLLVANPIDRYLINSPMLPTLHRDADGGLTIYVQHVSPGAAKAANWLPAPAGPFFMVTRLYWPKASVLDGTWTAPPLTVVK